MIETVADFLLTLKNKEVELLKKYEIIKHGPTIGDMYEGLTKSLLDKAIFKGLGLKVTAGKIVGHLGQFSHEIDCMLVVGEGDKIPYTDKEIYPAEQVIAVIQVKKNLYSTDLVDSHRNLLSVIDTIEERETQDYHEIMFKDSFRSICRREVPTREELNSLDLPLQYIYHSLLLETFYPCKIIWGYNGFSTEHALREAIVRYFQNNITTGPENKKAGFGPASLPDLIICNQFSIVKNNGIPYSSPLTKDNWMHVYVSSSKNPLHLLLEMVWTRLQYMFALSPEIFGEDLKLERVNRFLQAKLFEKGGMRGWLYRLSELSATEFKQQEGDNDWEPVLLTRDQYIILYALAHRPEIAIDGKDVFSQAVAAGNLDPVAFSESLRETGLIHVDSARIKLIAEQLSFVGTKEGIYAADNKTGRLSRWVQKRSGSDRP